MITVEEFICSVPEFDELTAERQNELLLYFLTSVGGADSATASQLDELRGKLSLPEHHTAQNLSKFSKRQHSGYQKYIKKPHGYALARTHFNKISKLFGERPAKAVISLQLRALTESMAEEIQRNYLEEAIGCFESKFHRAAIVLVWCLAYDKFRKWMFTQNLAAFNSVTVGWKKPFVVTVVEDFDELAERIIIDVARSSKAIGKEEHKVLVSLLDRRNSYAHPTGRAMAESIAEAFIHEAVVTVICKY